MSAKNTHNDIDVYSIQFSDMHLDAATDTYELGTQYLTEGGSTKLQFTTGNMIYIGHEGGKNNRIVELEFSDKNNDMYLKMLELENYILDWICKNGTRLVGSELNQDTVESMFRRFILLPLSLKTNPRIKIRLSRKIHLIKAVQDLNYNDAVNLTIVLERVRFNKNSFEAEMKIVEITKIEESSEDDSDESDDDSVLDDSDDDSDNNYE